MGFLELSVFLPKFASKYATLGCPENAKSLKSQAPQGFSGCLDLKYIIYPKIFIKK